MRRTGPTEMQVSDTFVKKAEEREHLHRCGGAEFRWTRACTSQCLPLCLFPKHKLGSCLLPPSSGAPEGRTRRNTESYAEISNPHHIPF